MSSCLTWAVLAQVLLVINVVLDAIKSQGLSPSPAAIFAASVASLNSADVKSSPEVRTAGRPPELLPVTAALRASPRNAAPVLPWHETSAWDPQPPCRALPASTRTAELAAAPHLETTAGLPAELLPRVSSCVAT